MVIQQLYDRVFFNHTHFSGTIQGKRKNVLLWYMNFGCLLLALPEASWGDCLKSLRVICTKVQSPVGTLSPLCFLGPGKGTGTSPRVSPACGRLTLPLEDALLSSSVRLSFLCVNTSRDPPLPVSLEVHNYKDCSCQSYSLHLYRVSVVHLCYSTR